MRKATRALLSTRMRFVLLAVLTLSIVSLGCNLINQPAAIETPTLNPVNTIPPTRTLPPTGLLPTALPFYTQQPTQMLIQPTFIQIQPTSLILPTAVPFYTATPFPTRIPTSTPLPSANVAIYSPVNNNVLAGIVQVLGSATHPFFVQAQLEFSPDPGNLWSLLPGSITTIPVQNGLLGLWDTRQTPDGIYQLRVRVFTSDGGSTVASVRNLRISNQTATPPPTSTSTATPTATYTASPIPTSTPLPSSTPTQLPTSTPTATGMPSATPLPTATYTDIPLSATPEPSPTIQTADLNAIPVVPAMSPAMITNLRAVYEAGLAAGNSPHRFIKVGDDNTANAAFLTGFGTGSYNLDVYAGLENVILFFKSAIREQAGAAQNSFTVNSAAAIAGWTAETPLQPGATQAEGCLAGESPLNCELRLTRPAIALIMFGTNDMIWFGDSVETFRAHLQSLVNTSLANGTIPVLSTIPERLDNTVSPGLTLQYNTAIVDVATASGVPLWNFWAAVRDLPNSGLSGDGIRLSVPPAGMLPTDLSSTGLAYGFNQRNLTALQVLDTIRTAIFPEVAWPQPTAEPTAIAVVPTEEPTVEIPTVTNIPAQPTATFTETALPTLEPTSTDIPPTEFFTETPTVTLEPSTEPTLTETPLPEPTLTETPLPTETFTLTPEPTLTETPIPTETFTLTPEPTLTETPIPTETFTLTPEPTLTETPIPTETFTLTPEPTLTETPVPTEAPTEVPPEPTPDLNTIPILPDFVADPELTQHVRAIFAAGQNLGLRNNVFAQAGDKLPVDPAFLDDLGTTDLVQWDTYQAELEQTLQTFLPVEGEQNPFTHISLAANAGWQAANLMMPEWADPGLCQPGETPLACEYRNTQAAYALISVGHNEADLAAFRQNLQTAVESTINAGVIPVLVTLPGSPESTLERNTIIVEVAEALNVPVWNVWLLLRDLPNYGVTPDGFLSNGGPGMTAIFAPDYLAYGANQANLSVLQMLKSLSGVVSQ